MKPEQEKEKARVARVECSEVAEQLERYLYSAKLSPHARLPGDRALAEQLGCHRNTVRAALHRLAGAGVVYFGKSSGVFMAAPKLRRNLSDFEALWYFAAQSSRAFTSQVLFADVINVPRAVASRLKLAQDARAFCLQRLRLLDGEPAILETTFLSAARFAGLERFDFSQNGLFEILSTEFDVIADKGAQRVGIVYADEREAVLLHLEEGAPLFSLSGMTFDDYDIPIEVFRSSVRGDLVGFWCESQMP